MKEKRQIHSKSQLGYPRKTESVIQEKFFATTVFSGVNFSFFIQAVPGEMCQTSGGCSLC